MPELDIIFQEMCKNVLIQCIQMQIKILPCVSVSSSFIHNSIVNAQIYICSFIQGLGFRRSVSDGI